MSKVASNSTCAVVNACGHSTQEKVWKLAIHMDLHHNVFKCGLWIWKKQENSAPQHVLGDPTKIPGGNHCRPALLASQLSHEKNLSQICFAPCTSSVALMIAGNDSSALPGIVIARESTSDA